MVTALDQLSDRVHGLEAGADDFLTKPVNDLALFARVRSLVRLKTMTDELRLREETGESLGIADATEHACRRAGPRPHPGRRRPRQSAQRIVEALGPRQRRGIVPQTDEALVRAKGGDFDLIIVEPVARPARRFAVLRGAAQLGREAQHADSGPRRRRRFEAARACARHRRQRLSDAPGGSQRAAGARAHAAAPEALHRQAAPLVAAELGDGGYRSADRPVQSPLHGAPS